MKALRKKSGLSRKYIVETLGIDVSTLNRIENGKGALPKLRLEKLSELYNCPQEEILKRWERMKYEKENSKKWVGSSL